MRVGRILHDRKEAERRIAKYGYLYKVESPKDLLLGEENFEAAGEAHRKECAIITDRGLFSGAVYSMLTPQQQYPEMIRCYKELESEGFCSPETAQNEQGVREVLKRCKINYYKKKTRFIITLPQGWDEQEIRSIIEAGVGHGKEGEQKARRDISKRVLGFGPKTSSLFLRMCGTEHLIPIDSSVSEMLYLHGYPCEIPRTRVNRPTGPKQRKTTIKGRRYLETEEFAFDLADKYRVPGYILQLAFWTKKSTYNAL